MKKLTCIFAAIMLVMLLRPNESFAQESPKETTGPAAKSSLMEVTFKIKGNGTDKVALESIQTVLQEIEGVPCVGVNYQEVEINVRYDSVKVSVQVLKTAIARMAKYEYSIATGPSVVSASAQIRSTPNFSNVMFECLQHEKAGELCEKHFKGELPEGIDLENSHTVKVDFQTVAHVDSNYDWLSQVYLVDEDGKRVKPLSWLEFPAGVTGTGKPGSGLLIFPKIPLLKLGLSLRLLRADGTGYDSFTVDVP